MLSFGQHRHKPLCDLRVVVRGHDDGLACVEFQDGIHIIGREFEVEDVEVLSRPPHRPGYERGGEADGEPGGDPCL